VYGKAENNGHSLRLLVSVESTFSRRPLLYARRPILYSSTVDLCNKLMLLRHVRRWNCCFHHHYHYAVRIAGKWVVVRDYCVVFFAFAVAQLWMNQYYCRQISRPYSRSRLCSRRPTMSVAVICRLPVTLYIVAKRYVLEQSYIDSLYEVVCEKSIGTKNK